MGLGLAAGGRNIDGHWQGQIGEMGEGRWLKDNFLLEKK